MSALPRQRMPRGLRPKAAHERFGSSLVASPPFLPTLHTEVMESLAHLRSNHVPPRSQKDRRSAMRVSEANYLVDVGDNIVPLSRASSMATVKNVSSVTVCGRAATLTTFRNCGQCRVIRARTHTVNVLVIGAGGAGLRAAIAAHQAGAEVSSSGSGLGSTRTRCSPRAASTPCSAPVTPRTRGSSTSPTRSREGYLLGDPGVVEILRVKRRPGRGAGRVGMPFARTEDGRLDQRSSAPTAGGAPATPATTRVGRSSDAARRSPAGDPGRRGHYVSACGRRRRCFGALAFDLHDGRRTAFVAATVVLCGGGHTRVWRRSSSRGTRTSARRWRLALRPGAG